MSASIFIWLKTESAHLAQYSRLEVDDKRSATPSTSEPIVKSSFGRENDGGRADGRRWWKYDVEVEEPDEDVDSSGKIRDGGEVSNGLDENAAAFVG